MKIIRNILVASVLATITVFGVSVICIAPIEENHADQLTQFVVSESFKTPLHSFKIHVGRFPTSVEGLKALVVNSGIEGWQGPYVEAETNLLDPWGRPFRYRIPGIHNFASYDLYSRGEDGIESDDDITNWN